MSTNRTALNTEQRVSGALNGLVKLYDLRMGSHLSRAHVVNFLHDAGEPSYLASDVIRGLQTGVGVEILDAADNASAATPTGGLDGFFQQSQVANLDWLAVDRDAYRATEILPFQSFDITPDLVEAWDHTDAAQGIHLVPARPNDPSVAAALGEKSRRQETMKAASAVAENIWYRVRMAMVEGKSFQKARELAFSTLNGSDMPIMMKRRIHAHLVQGLEKVAAEEGLIGNIYVVAKDFPGCQKGQVPTTISRSKSPFVIAKSQCGGCKYASASGAPVEDTQAWMRGTANTQAQMNSCAQFRKQLVVEVPYSEELARRLQVKASGDPSQVKAQLRTAFTRKAATYTPYDNKPIQRDITAGLTPEGAMTSIIAAQDKEEMSKEIAAREAQIADVVAFTKRRMNEGMIGKVLGDKVAGHFTTEQLKVAATQLKDVFAEQGLAGHHYIDASAYPNCHRGDVDNLHRVRASLMKQRPSYVLKKTACQGCPCNKGGGCSSVKGALVDKMEYPNGRQAALVQSLRGGRVIQAANEWSDDFGLQTGMTDVDYAGGGPDVNFDLQDSEFRIEM